MLLLVIWRAIDPDFKSQYRREIWRMFGEAVRVSASQSPTLKRFASSLCQRVHSSLGRNDQDRAEAKRCLDADQADEQAILRLYRTETPYIVLLVQDAMMSIREQAEAEYEDHQA